MLEPDGYKIYARRRRAENVDWLTNVIEKVGTPLKTYWLEFVLDPAVHGMGATKWVVWAIQIDLYA